MTIKIARFEALQIDRLDKSTLAIRDHKYDKDIIHIQMKESSDVVAAAIIEKLEDLIESEEITW